MTETETRVKGEGADEELIVFKVTVSESVQDEASAFVSGIPINEAAGSDSNAEPSATVLVKFTEEASTLITKERVGDKVGVTDEQNKEGISEKEEGRGKEATVEREKGSTPSTNAWRSLERKKRVASNDINVEPSVLVKVEEQASAIMIVDREDKAGEGGNKEQSVKGEAADERTKIGALSNPASRIQKRKKVALAIAGTSAAAMKYNDQKTAVADKVESALSKEEGNKVVVLNEGEKAYQGMKTTGFTIATISTAVAAETANDDGEKEKVADRGKVDRPLNKMNKKRKKRNKARVAAAEAAGAAEIGADKKSVEKEHAGMIFMCSAETKRDCYRYKVFGMPAGKKEAVAKVYKGMKLFLYDIDLKLLYGIYIASSKGGYNIQPKAFNSAFPSQVRFKLLKDYLPLPEEKFKAAITTNYYKKKKFSLELSAEQVKKLSKLFVEATKASKRANGLATRERVPRDFISHDTKRRRFEGTVSCPVMDEGVCNFPRSRAIYEREDYASQVPLQIPFPRHGSAVARQAPLPLYSSPPWLATLPPLPPPAYVYERPRDVNYYRRQLPMEAHGYRLIDPEMRLPLDHVGHSDPYSLHREPTPYHETCYTLTLPPSYHAPAPPY